jgi:hypothetical protein
VAAGDAFARCYAHSYRGLFLTAHALLDDAEAAEQVTREAFAIVHRDRARLAADARPEERVRAVVVRLARRRLRWRALQVPRARPAAPSARETVRRLHRLAGLPTETIASVVDTPVETVESYLVDAEPVSWAGVRQPVVTRVVERARLRAARARTLGVAAVAVLVVGVAVPLLRVGSPEPEAAKPAYTPPSPTYTPQSEMVQPRVIYDVGFVDERHAHALRADCRQFDCDLDLVSTSDGEHWTSRPVSNAGQPRGSGGRLYVLGPDQVAVDWFPIDEPAVLGRVYSADSGRTWTRVPQGVRGTAREIPAGAALQSGCELFEEPCTRSDVRVILPDSGRSARLATAPPLLGAYPGMVPMADGRWWITGKDPRTRRWTIALSDDDGRTWTVARPAWRGDAEGQAWTIVACHDSIVATVTGQLEVGDYGILAMFRSDDGGRSWTKTRGELGWAVAGAPVAASNGSLLVNTEDGAGLVSWNDGRTFTQEQPRYHGFAYWARSGYVALSSPDAPIQYSPDGLNWRELSLKP